MSTSPHLLLLADGRFPAGGHAHSGGVEAAVGAGDIGPRGEALRAFVEGRLATSGRVEAAFAAATCAACAASPAAQPVDWCTLDDELSARLPSPRLRATSRTLGRQMLRAGDRVWPSRHAADCRAALPDGPLQPLAFGLVAHAAGLGPQDAALCALHHLVTAATSAAVRLLGIDPFQAAALSAQLAPTLTELAGAAAASAHDPVDSLPAGAGLLADVMAEHHATWEVRLFAS